MQQKVCDHFYDLADDAKNEGDSLLYKDELEAAATSCTQGLEFLKQAGEKFTEPFNNRAALLLSRRANIHLKREEFRPAMRDAIGALELVRSLASAETAFAQAAAELGVDKAGTQRLLESIGNGRILDPGTPLILRCVDRWVSDLMESVEEKAADFEVPEPRHMEVDRYLDGVDEDVREEMIKRYVPGYHQPDGGTGAIMSAKQCLELMKQWEEAFNGNGFKQSKGELWEHMELNNPQRLYMTQVIIARSLHDILVPMGFAPGRPGLSRCIKQMQHYWSIDGPCSKKALDLEELADVSLADLQM